MPASIATSQPVTKEVLIQFIDEGKAAGKDVSELEEALAQGKYYTPGKTNSRNVEKTSETIAAPAGVVREDDLD